jgi:single-stranded-DNA-specific exonuclease
VYHPKTRWIQSQIDEQRVEELVREAGIHPMIARILVLRGLNSQEQVARFLRVSTDDFHDPYHLHGMGKAVTRIRRALEDKEKIWIYGDYDADGVSSTSVMIETFRLLGQEVDYYIPNRFTEGYGLNRQAVELAAKRGVSLIITVDTGITAVNNASWKRVSMAATAKRYSKRTAT